MNFGSGGQQALAATSNIMSIPIFCFTPDAFAPLPPALAESAKLFNTPASPPLTAEILAQYRQRLWQALPQSIQADLINCQAAHILSIHSDQALWQQLPWELLAEPKATNPRYLVRSVNQQPQSLPLIAKPVRCLWLGLASFAGQARLALEHEQQVLKQSVAAFGAQIDLQCAFIHDLAALKAVYAQQTWDIVIISGHGVVSAQEWSQLTLFLNEEQRLTGQQLAHCLQTQTPHLLVINTCLSATVNSPQHSLLWPLLNIGIPHIVGMQGHVVDRAGLKFIQALLNAVWQATPIAQAVHMGRMAMQQLLATDECWRDEQDPSFGQWVLPVLYSAAPEQALLSAALSVQAEANNPPTTSLLIGRRPLLQNLLAILTASTTQGVWLHGVAGSGKTALAQAVLVALSELGFKVQAFTQTTCDAPEPNTVYYADDLPQTFPLPNTPLRCLLIARHLPANLPDFIHAQAVPLASYEEFLGYAQHLGLPHPELQIKLMFRVWRGRFRGLEIISSLPVCTGKALVQQVDQVGRCLVGRQSYR